MFGPTPRYNPFHPCCCWMSLRANQMCFPRPPRGAVSDVWNLTLSRSSGFMHNVATTPAPIPAAAWSYTSYDELDGATKGGRAHQSSSRKEARRLLYHSSSRRSSGTERYDSVVVVKGKGNGDHDDAFRSKTRLVEGGQSISGKYRRAGRKPYWEGAFRLDHHVFLQFQAQRFAEYKKNATNAVEYTRPCMRLE